MAKIEERDRNIKAGGPMAGTDTGTEDKENGDLRVTAETRFKQCSDEENPAGSFKRSFSHRPGRGRRGRSFGLVAALSLILLAVPTLAEEGSTSKETEKKKHTWTGEIETGLIYDSNVFQAKSKIESDLIWESAFSLAYRPRKTRWSGSAVLNRYLQIQELNYSFFEIGGESPFGEKYYGSLFLQFSPPASLDKEDPTLPTIELGSAGFTAQIDRDLTSWWNTGLSVTYNRLDYNADFDAKDTDLVRLGLPQTFRPALSWRLLIDYAVEAGSAKGGAVPIDGEAVREDNASYRAQAGGVQISYRFGSPADGTAAVSRPAKGLHHRPPRRCRADPRRTARYQPSSSHRTALPAFPQDPDPRPFRISLEKLLRFRSGI